MAARQTFDAKRAQELFDQGHGCNAIARAMGVSTWKISTWAKSVGLVFDRSQTEMAVRANTIDMAADRLELAQLMTVAAKDLLLSLDGTYLVHNFGGKDNTYAEHELARPPVEVVRNAVTTAGIAFDKATKVLEKTNEGIGRAESLVDHLEAFFDSTPDEPVE